MADWQEIEGGITAPKGFKSAGMAAGLKPSGLPDLALIVSETEAIAAGVFTTSQVRAKQTPPRGKLDGKMLSIVPPP
jgi:glutamate N-acetyltransferase/amino-acid N-acetyltransferase